ncbi:hypothetical protein GCM10025768_11810 [Microbacterium pseudoresistens]|uniref:Pimeloyl-ACP methyl ester carboxylesterase/quinol monooxygenase YgiN n=1 Tax=Microbacterium pseudoresistens TaxID=640634 RepID=A0A7Y9EWG1_9MICO|nr:alpha/beta fold hydrolase [Microbacterium pseudoresistens]NYD55084.1 pimeloyl-ACP methyl ester carboxylesterase/quinol monooxygenase YgiN [Microbacterium pseudoresistens]
MLLNAITTGDGPRTVLLLHGMMGSAQSWWRVSEEVAARGHRAVALDLPGHGLSPRDPSGTIASAADAVAATVRTLAIDGDLVAIGHSYGGTVLSAAAERLNPAVEVYVDTICAFAGGADAGQQRAEYARVREIRRDPDALRAARPAYSDSDIRVESLAAQRFDPETAASVTCSGDVSHPPRRGSLLVRAQPSAFVSDDDAARLRAEGVDVREIDGAAHTVWYTHFEEFVDALPEAFGPPRERRGVTLTGLLVCRSDAEADAVREHLAAHIDLTRAEAGCVSFDVAATDDPLVWSVAEHFRDAEAFRAHQRRVAESAWGRATEGIERRYSVAGI